MIPSPPPHRGRTLIRWTTQDFRWYFGKKNHMMIVDSWDNCTAPQSSYRKLSHPACAVLIKWHGYKAVILRSSHGNSTMTVQPPHHGSTFSFLDLFPFPPFVLCAISTNNTSRNVSLYTFRTQMPKYYIISQECTEIMQSPCHLCTASVWKLHGLCAISVKNSLASITSFFTCKP